MPRALHVVPFGPQATHALRSAIIAAKGGDALAPVTVAVSSNYVGLALRRQLGREGALVNVRFLVLARVAELLGAAALANAGKRPLTPWLAAEAVRATLAFHVASSPGGVFAPVGEHLATELSLAATFRDLRDAEPAMLDRLAGTGPRAAEVVALFRGYRQLTSVLYYDSADLALAAADAVAAGTPTLRDIGHVVLFLPRTFSQPEFRLVDALVRRGKATVILGVSGSRSGDASTDRLRARLEPVLGPATSSPTEVRVATRIVTVTDSHEEVRMVGRLVMERLRAGTPLHRMAVLFPVKEQYAAALHEQFHAAGIPHNGPAVTTLAQSITGRFLLGMLKLPASGFRRDAVMDWLTSAPVIGPHNGPAPTGVWDSVSRAAGVVAGAGEWDQRLERHSRSLEQRKADVDRPPSEGQRRHIDRDLLQVGSLRTFVRELVTELVPGGRTTWREHARWAARLLDRYLGGITAFSTPAGQQQEDFERSVHDQVVEQIRNLEALDEVTGTAGVSRAISQDTFIGALEQLLQAPVAPVGRFGEGVFVAALGDAAGMEFDVVFIPGMAEGLAPAIGRDDPLLPDHERGAASADLPLRSSRRDDETRNYLAALASAPERVLLYSAADLAGQQKRLPSRWLLESAGVLSGSAVPLGTKDFDALPPAAPWLTRSASFHAALRSGVEPALLQEYDLRSLSRGGDPAKHPLAMAEPIISRGIMAMRYRRQPSLTRFDGFIGPRHELRPSAAHPTSPSALQEWATCPFRYFLHHVMGVAERQDPEDILVLSPAERGNIIHAALDEFMKQHADWRGPWNSGHAASLRAIADVRCAEAEAEGITGKPLLWRLERDRIHRDLEGFLDADATRSKDTGFHFLAGEHSFGNAGDANPAVAVALADGSSVRFRGRIDRVDQHAGGRLAVYDYKSGGTSSYEGMDVDATKGGQLLQLPIYALAARDAFARDHTVDVEASYWFVTQRGKYQTKGLVVTDDSLDVFRAQLLNIVTGIGQGLFVANPGGLDTRNGGSSKNCHFCPYDRLCPPGRRRTWERKQADPAAAVYLALTGANGDANAAD